MSYQFTHLEKSPPLLSKALLGIQTHLRLFHIGCLKDNRYKAQIVLDRIKEGRKNKAENRGFCTGITLIQLF
jgi:hypothetical protein